MSGKWKRDAIDLSICVNKVEKNSLNLVQSKDKSYGNQFPYTRHTTTFKLQIDLMVR